MKAKSLFCGILAASTFLLVKIFALRSDIDHVSGLLSKGVDSSLDVSSKVLASSSGDITMLLVFSAVIFVAAVVGVLLPSADKELGGS